MSKLTVEKIRNRWNKATPGPWICKLYDDDQSIEEAELPGAFFHLLSISDDFVPPTRRPEKNGDGRWPKLVAEINRCEQHIPAKSDISALVNAPTDIAFLLSAYDNVIEAECAMVAECREWIKQREELLAEIERLKSELAAKQ